MNWLHPDLEERAGLHGRGTFASRSIKHGTLVAIFGGHVLDVKSANNDMGLQIERNFVIDTLVYPEGGGDFVNHSCSPNCGIRGQISLFAMRDISAAEEITFDYGSVIFAATEKDGYTLECLCAAPSCRKLITSEDWRNKELQTRLGKYFPYFILDAIEVENRQALAR